MTEEDLRAYLHSLYERLPTEWIAAQMLCHALVTDLVAVIRTPEMP